MSSILNIATIILQYGHWRKTVECVKSILSNDRQPQWIIVVDNASPDDSGQKICDFLNSLQPGGGLYIQKGETPADMRDISSSMILIELPVNKGYASGNNAGLRLALSLGAAAMLILNNDTTLEREAIGALWERLQECPKPGMCGALVVYERENMPVQCLGGGHTNYVLGLSSFSGAGMSLEEAKLVNRASAERGMNFICGACVMVSRKFVETIGMLDEMFFLYCEEQDWALRAAGKFDLAWAPKAVIHHHEGCTTGWSRYEFTWRGLLRLARSRLRLTWKHFPQYLPTVILCMGYSALRLGARGITKAITKTVKLK